MGKKPKRQRRANKAAAIKTAKRSEEEQLFEGDVSDDEIDAFHKQRDVIPLDIDGDVQSDGDSEEAVLDLEGVDSEDSDDADMDDDLDTSNGRNADTYDPKLLAKMESQLKHMQSIQEDDGISDEEDSGKEEKVKAAWGRHKNKYYDADNRDYEIQSSDEDLPKEEEEQVLQIQKKKALNLSREDFGLEDFDQPGGDQNEQKSFKIMALNDVGPESYEELKRDLGSMSREEQDDAAFSSAPVLVGLLSELNMALEQIVDTGVKTKMTCMLEKEKGGLCHSDINRALLLLYCQAISCYLLLKTEGLSVRDHPVIARLVDIKNLINEMKQMDWDNPTTNTFGSTSSNGYEAPTGHGLSLLNAKSDGTTMPSTADRVTEVGEQKARELAEADEKDKVVSDPPEMERRMGVLSKEMLKVRANLEAKLKEKGLYKFPKSKRQGLPNTKTAKRGFEALDDFDDDVQQDESVRIGGKIKELVPSKANKSKFASGDDDIPKRDPIGERRRKFEDRVLKRLGSATADDDEGNSSGNPDEQMPSRSRVIEPDALESEDEFYKEAKRRKTEKQLAKEQMHSVKPAVPALEQDKAEGKRQITYQIEKNRGLTRQRKKLAKIPRKKYKLKHKKKVIGRKGQVRDVRRPSGPYGGEETGINKGVSRSVRLK